MSHSTRRRSKAAIVFPGICILVILIVCVGNFSVILGASIATRAGILAWFISARFNKATPQGPYSSILAFLALLVAPTIVMELTPASVRGTVSRESVLKWPPSAVAKNTRCNCVTKQGHALCATEGVVRVR